MVSKTSSAKAQAPDEGEAVLLSDFGQELTRLRAEYEAKYGHPCEPPRNSGKRRTASKRALLAEIEKVAAAKGIKW